MTLEEFIEEQKRIVAERRQRGETGPPPPRPTAEYEALLAANIADAIVRLGDSLPEPLRQFVAYAGDRPDFATLQSYPLGWIPRFFKVVSPRLAEMSFSTVFEPPDVMRVQSIRVGDKRFPDWPEAIAVAAFTARR